MRAYLSLAMYDALRQRLQNGATGRWGQACQLRACLGSEFLGPALSVFQTAPLNQKWPQRFALVIIQAAQNVPNAHGQRLVALVEKIDQRQCQFLLLQIGTE